MTDIPDQMNLIDIFRAFHPKTTEYTFFSSVHRTFSKIDHMLDCKTSLSKFKETEKYIKHLLRPQWYETRNQWQEKKKKKENTQT